MNTCACVAQSREYNRPNDRTNAPTYKSVRNCEQRTQRPKVWRWSCLLCMLLAALLVCYLCVFWRTCVRVRCAVVVVAVVAATVAVFTSFDPPSTGRRPKTPFERCSRVCGISARLLFVRMRANVSACVGVRFCGGRDVVLCVRACCVCALFVRV